MDILFFSSYAQANGAQLRNGDTFLVFHNQAKGFRTGTKFFSFYSGNHDRKVSPLFPEGKRRSCGLPFGLLVKWAVKLLGGEEGVVSARYPRQYLSALQLRIYVQWNRPLKDQSRKDHIEVLESRGDRGVSWRRENRLLFSSAPESGRITIDDVEIFYDKTHDEWYFEREWLTLEEAVKVAVRILRDVKTEEEWTAYSVPWLADEDELASNTATTIAGTDVTLDVVALDSNDVGIARATNGYRLVQVTDYEDSSSGPIHIGDLNRAPRFATWGGLVDSLCDLVQELEPNVLSSAAHELPLMKEGQRLSSWLYPSGSKREVEAKEKAKKALAAKYGNVTKPHALFSQLQASGNVALPGMSSGGLRLELRFEQDTGFALLKSNGENPTLGIDEVMGALGYVLSAEFTQSERPLHSATWLIGWLERCFGALPASPLTTPVEQPQSESSATVPTTEVTETKVTEPHVSNTDSGGTTLQVYELPALLRKHHKELCSTMPKNPGAPALEPVTLHPDFKARADLIMRNFLQRASALRS